MASSDATAIPIKGQAYRVTFPIIDETGDLVSSAAGLSSKVSKDGNAFANSTNSVVQIATNSGVYYLDLTSTEMNANTVAVIISTTTENAKSTTLIFYPASPGDIPVNVKQINGTNQTARDIGASVLLSPGTGSGQVSLSSGKVTVGTNDDKSGYSLATAPPTAGQIKTEIEAGGSTLATLLSRIVGTLASGTHKPQSGDAFARLGAPAGVSHAADNVAIKADTGAAKTVTDKLNSTLQSDGDEGYQFTELALANAPAGEGGGGGVADWTSGEKEQIRSALGVDGTKTAATGGQLQTVKSQTDKLADDIGSRYWKIVSD